MSRHFTDNWTTQLRKGVLELSILNALREERRYGYDIVRRLREIRGLVIGEGTVYPILSRLKREGLVATELVDSPEGPARKYYRLTDRGREVLAWMNEHWSGLVESLESLRRGGEV